MPSYYLSVSVGTAVMPDSSFLLVIMGFLLFMPPRGTLFRTFFCTYLSRHLLLLTPPRGVKSLPTVHPHPLLIPYLNIQTPKILPKWPPAHFQSLLGPLAGPPWAIFIGVWLVYSVFLLNWCAIIRHLFIYRKTSYLEIYLTSHEYSYTCFLSDCVCMYNFFHPSTCDHSESLH